MLVKIEKNQSNNQSAKFENANIRRIIREQLIPGDAKKVARTFIIRTDWDQVKLSMMEYLLRQKFNREDMWFLLRQTKNEELVEKNQWHDNFWGSCTCIKCGDVGENWLGKVLMKVRGFENRGNLSHENGELDLGNFPPII